MRTNEGASTIRHHKRKRLAEGTAFAGALLLLLQLAASPARCHDEELRRQFEDDFGGDDEIIRRVNEQHSRSARTHGGGIQAPKFHFELPEVLDSRPDELKLLGPAPKPQTYGVIVDCGSSGTRAHLYHWDTEIDFSLQMLHDIEPLRYGDKQKPLTKKVEPGLSSLVEASEQQRRDYIEPLMDFISESIPASRHKYTGIYFMATAGMRLLERDDRDSIMNDIKQFVKQRYNFAKIETSVITGSDEGMYQWISINAKSKRFLGEQTSTKTKTYAVIEMGGASIQVIYQLRNGVGHLQAKSLAPELRPLYWAQAVTPAISRSDAVGDYELHSTTFLGLGINTARDAFIDLLIHQQSWSALGSILSIPKRIIGGSFGRAANKREPGSQQAGSASFKGRHQQVSSSRLLAAGKDNVQQVTRIYEDPCLPSGYQTSEPLRRPKRMLDRHESKGKTIGFKLEDDQEPSFGFLLRGTGNYEKCRKLNEQMLKTARDEMMFCEDKPRHSCTMSLLGERFVPFQKFEFVAISGFYYAFTNAMIGEDGSYNHYAAAQRTQTICDMPYEELKAKFGAKMKEEHMLSACFRAVFADTFLVKGLKLPEDFDMLETKNKINNDDLDWTLGAVLDKSLAIEQATDQGLEQ